jgi:CHAT domain-containing protein/tetratricopeptide (TPR) repeat protein
MASEALRDVVVAFVSAANWLERKRIVEQHRKLLLSDAADVILANGSARNRHNPSLQRLLESCRTVLQDCRAIGVDAAFVSPIGPISGLTEALGELMGAESASSTYRIVIEHADMLLTNEADWTLIALAASESENMLFVERIAHLRDTLARCRREGTDAAFAEMLRDEHRGKALKALMLSIYSLDKMRQVLEQYREVLLTDEAEAVVAKAQATPDLKPAEERLYESLRALLAIARTDGIQTAVMVHRFPPFERFLNRAFATLVKHKDEPQDVVLDIRMVLASNIHFLDGAFPAKLREWVTEQLEGDQPQWHFAFNADMLGHFAKAIRAFPLGSRADNLEIAISCYEAAGEFCDRLANDKRRVAVSNNLGLVYMDRVRESRADNVERAIDCFQQALAHTDRPTDPELWARITSNLGNAYVERSHGARIDNIETAITLYNDALGAISREQHQERWSSLHNELGLAYSRRVRGEHGENIERAIFHCEEALTATPHASPEDRSATYNNLALIYVDRERGDRAENIERAIQYGHEVLALTDRASAPMNWADIQVNLGRAHAASDVGSQGENIERAIDHYRQALEVFTRHAYPAQWARVQNNLGNCLRRRKQGDADENKRLAIAHIEQALEIYTRDTHPEEWARATSDLAAAHTYVPFHIYTDFEVGWAAMEETGKHYNRAIELHQKALEVRSPDLLPQESLDTAYQRGQALATHGRYAEARVAFEIAHSAIRTIRGEASRESAKRSISAMSKGLYEHLVRTCLRLDDVEAAFTYAAAGKGRAFVDMLTSARFDLSAAAAGHPDMAADLQRARVLRQEIDNLLAYLSGESHAHPAGENASRGEVEIRLRELQAQEQTLWGDMAHAYPALTATKHAPEITPANARDLAAALDATLVEFFPHEDGWSAFVVTVASITHIPLPQLTEEFIDELTAMVRRIGSRIERCPLSYRRLEALHKVVITPLQDAVPRDRPLFLAPYGMLHMLPLAAARDPQNGQYVIDTYRLAFAPSVAALWVAWQQTERIGQSSVPLNQALSVAYPGAAGGRNFLPNVIPEAEAVAGRFANTVRLYGQDATPNAVVTRSAGHAIVHFGCHGAFNADYPEQSGLMLAGGWLTVQRLLTDLKLEGVRICTLGACVSGLARVAEGDEPIGLAHAMLVAGAQVVVASLWNVHDAATRTLFEGFYGGIAAGLSPAEALHVATLAVRRSPQWQHPYYWAAFQVIGLAHMPVPVAVPVAPTPDVLASADWVRDAFLVKKSAQETIEDALSLLEQLQACDDLTQAALKELGRDLQRPVINVLTFLPQELAAATDSRRLLQIAHDVLALVENTPALRRRFMLEDTEETVAQEQRQRDLQRQGVADELRVEDTTHFRDRMLTVARMLAAASAAL